MTKDQHGSSGATQDPSGDAENNPNNSTNLTEPKADSVSYETHKKLLSEKKKMQERLEAMETQAKQREQKELEEKEEYKKLYESAKNEAGEWKQKFSGLDGQLTESVKLRSVLDQVEGEVPKQYWSLIDTSSVVIDPETRLPDEGTVMKAVKEFQANYPEVIRKPNGTRMPNDAAKGSGAKLTYEQWLTLPLDEKKKRIKEVQKEA